MSKGLGFSSHVLQKIKFTIKIFVSVSPIFLAFDASFLSVRTNTPYENFRLSHPNKFPIIYSPEDDRSASKMDKTCSIVNRGPQILSVIR